MRPRLALLNTLCLALLTLGCNPFAAAKWEDDPENYQRIFNSEKPPYVTVVRSYYYRSAHWSFEFRYYIALQGNEQTRRQIFSGEQYKKYRSGELDHGAFDNLPDKPEWFLPGSSSDYDVWVYKDEPRQNFRLFVHRKTGDLYLTDYQM